MAMKTVTILFSGYCFGVLEAFIPFASLESFLQNNLKVGEQY
jgi:hypothetical protein